MLVYQRVFPFFRRVVGSEASTPWWSSLLHMSFSFFLPLLLLFLTIIINIIAFVSLNYKSEYETPDHWHTSSRVSSIGKKNKPPTDSMHPRNKYTLLLVALQLGFSPAANDSCIGSCRWFTTWKLVIGVESHPTSHLQFVDAFKIIQIESYLSIIGMISNINHRGAAYQLLYESIIPQHELSTVQFLHRLTWIHKHRESLDGLGMALKLGWRSMMCDDV